MDVTAGRLFTAELENSSISGNVGARVEVSGTRAIVSYWRPASQTGDTWTVTLEAPLDCGDYCLVWMDGAGTPGFAPIFDPLHVMSSVGTVTADLPAIDVAKVTPTTAEVAQILRTRTVEAGGNDVGEFTDTTRPSVDEVEDVVDQAVDNVLAQLRPWCDIRHYSQIKRAVGLHAAVMIETSYYRETAGDAAVNQLRTQERSVISGIQQRMQEDLNQELLLGTMEPR